MQPVADMPFTAQLFRCGGITQKDIKIDETVYFTCCPYPFVHRSACFLTCLGEVAFAATEGSYRSHVDLESVQAGFPNHYMIGFYELPGCFLRIR